MNRLMTLMLFVLTCTLVRGPASADDPPRKLTADERKELEAKWKDHIRAATTAYQGAQYADAQKASEQALALARRLYPKDEFPDGHQNLAVSLGNLAIMHHARGKLDEAEPLFAEALAIRRRLFKGDHAEVAKALNNLASVLRERAKPADAEPLFAEALAMQRRLVKGDNPQVALVLQNLAMVLRDQGKDAEAEPLLREAVEVFRKVVKGDHAELARATHNLGLLLQSRRKDAEAAALFTESLEMRKRLFKGDHPDLAESLNKAGDAFLARGKLAEAEEHYTRSVDMYRKVYKGTHPDLAGALGDLTALRRDQGKYAEAERLCRETLDMYRRVYKGDHRHVATALHNLALLLSDQGKSADAEPPSKEALEIRKRLFKGDHADLADSMANLAAALRGQGKLADAEPLSREALDMYRRVYKGDDPDLVRGLINRAGTLREQGRYAEAGPLSTEAVDMARRLFKGDHRLVAHALTVRAAILHDLGRPAEAEQLHSDGLEMRKRLFKGDHPELAESLNGLAALLRERGRLAEAEGYYAEALEMRKRLFPGDHPLVAHSLHNLAGLFWEQGKYAEAGPPSKEAMDMYRRAHKGDHPELARILHTRALLAYSRGEKAEAETLYRDALAMRRRLHPGDHPHVAESLNNMAAMLRSRGKPAEAEPFMAEAVRMWKRLFPGDHPDVAQGLRNLGVLHEDQGRLAEAEPLQREALAMARRVIEAFAGQSAEGEALTLAAGFPPYRDVYLAVARRLGTDPAAVYAEVWASKALVSRVYERRQQAARAAADPAAAKILVEIADARRLRAELLLAPHAGDAAVRRQRDEDIRKLEARIADLDRAVRPLLPTVERAERLANATPRDLQKVLPADAAVIDFLEYSPRRFDKSAPGGEARSPGYLAFVVTRDKVAWVDLGPAGPVEAAVNAWREAITRGQEIPAAVPARVRELVWEKVRRELPAAVKTVYVSPDMALYRVPWAALPGDKPGTILLEDFAVAAIPHGAFLLDQLWPRDERKGSPAGVLVVGGVGYGAEPGAVPTAAGGGPLLKPGEKPGWNALPGTAAEAGGVSAAAAGRKLRVTVLKDDRAAAAAVLTEMPRARYAHLATHGFFADPSFRGLFQLDERDFQKAPWGERVGRAVNSPLVMTGIVLAGANNPKTPGRGIVTGESLLDLDLSGLELAVLSACETGLGDVAGGEGTFGLQRAFHYAGTRDVVASLWKVPDRSTAALMALFYRNLWEKNLTPVESLRQAQLEVYRNPAKIAELADGFRGKFGEVGGPGGDGAVTPTADGKAHPRLWAAFTLSGPGR